MATEAEEAGTLALPSKLLRLLLCVDSMSVFSLLSWLVAEVGGRGAKGGREKTGANAGMDKLKKKNRGSVRLCLG